MKSLKYLLVFAVILAACTPEKYSELNEGIYAEISTKKGDILLELYADDAPMTVANFVSLVEGTNSKLLDSFKGKNFYEGIIFHRVVNNFVIQGGGFTAKGRKNPGYVFGDEFPKSEDGNLLYRHDDKGILSMANGGPTTNNSQFFITHRPIPHLDGKHSVFGKTIINSLQLKDLKSKFKDSLQLEKAVDSLRMGVVNSIVQKDTILSIKIIKLGSKANSFNAAEVFDTQLEKLANSEKDLKKAEAEVEKARYATYLADKETFLAKMDEGKAEKTSSGLRILKLKKTSGKKVVDNKPLSINYTLYTADGKKIQSTSDSNGKPFVCQLNDEQRPMIAGFKEGVSKMREGEKVRLFIPYYLGYGEAKYGPFPAKSDLVFEIEVLKIGK
ncbi:peptidylprolyl isomerase [Polaribacter sp. Hel1_85]|uniref:peptidylprolyl isomerase n=1 Tax=Polaribacter sp. Hel1_85 TaxID=1250005 RepID=UPI00052E18B4|nr:peptidylprolyl isomerase [Polaribacter sp. Hel1_85]KGL63690.1 peptidyl-prolyl cis-trans isomerase [Polaribacter sp. Hel1_85]